MDCSCTVKVTEVEPPFRMIHVEAINYCPTHLSAPEMRKLLADASDLLWEIDEDCAGPCADLASKIDALRAAESNSPSPKIERNES